jgi:phage terminase large subunit
MDKLRIQISPPFELFAKRHARYKFAHGGRGGSKSHSAARILLGIGMQYTKRVLCAREVQKSIKESIHTLLSDIIKKYELTEYEITDKDIYNKRNGTSFIFTGLKEHTVNSIKSMEGIDIVLLEEAQTVSAKSLDILTPTIRVKGSEIWALYNRYSFSDPIHQLFKQNCTGDGIVKSHQWGETELKWTEWESDNAIGLYVNYDANPWFTEENRAEMELDKSNNVELYNHKWLGHPISMADNCLIPLQAVLVAQGRTVKEWEHITIGCDPARYGDDESVVFVREGFRVLPALTFRGINTSRLSAEIIKICRDYYAKGYHKTIRIMVDDTGLGAGVTDQLETAQNEEKVKPDPAFSIEVIPLVNNAEAGEPEYKDLGAQLWGELKKALETISLPEDQELIEQLTSRKYHIEPDGRIKLERKDDMKKRGLHSPDRADALALCMYSGQTFDFGDAKIVRHERS